MNLPALRTIPFLQGKSMLAQEWLAWQHTGLQPMRLVYGLRPARLGRVDDGTGRAR